MLPRVTGHNCHFLNVYYVSGTLHNWYLFNSHSGHTKKLFLRVDETETPCSGAGPESRASKQRQDRHMNLVSASLQRTFFPGFLLPGSAVPGLEGCLVPGGRDRRK